MEKRRFGKTELSLSILGFGAMRLPGFDTGKFAEYMDGAVELMKKGFDRGINYVDTSAIYDGGQSEKAVGLAVKGRRENIIISSKILPIWITGADQFEKLLEASLKRLDTSYLDIFYLHGIRMKEFEGKLKDLKIMERMEKLKDQGLIRHIGYSAHDKPEGVVRLVESGAFECMLIQYNFLDTSYSESIEKAHESDMGVAIMGPIGGGRLSGMGPEFNRLIPENLGSAPEMALRFVWGNPGVATALSGINRMDVLEQNLKFAESFTPLTEADDENLTNLRKIFDELKSIYCTGCAYCMPCEQGVKIPDVFYAYICQKILGSPEYAKLRYNFQLARHKADLCTECGECEPKCPQNIPIIKQLKEAHKAMTGPA